mgnify:CR=1 FL=1
MQIFIAELQTKPLLRSAVNEDLAQEFDSDVEGLRARKAEAAEVRIYFSDTPGNLPALLRVARGRGMAGNQQLNAVRAMEAKAVEHVR